MYAPCVGFFRPEASFLSNPWGLQIARFTTGKKFNDWKFKNPEQIKYWTNHYNWEAVAQLATFMKSTMNPKTFQNIKCPVFLGYYYEDIEHQDKVVSVTAMQQMFQQLATPSNLKREVDFKKAKEHVIACDLVSEDWRGVEIETTKFLKEVLNLN